MSKQAHPCSKTDMEKINTQCNIQITFTTKRLFQCIVHIYSSSVQSNSDGHIYRMVDSIVPDKHNYLLSMITASHLKLPENAVKIHSILSQHNPELVENDLLIQNGLIDMYLKCGELLRAQQVFGVMKNKKDIGTWNILINGLVRDHKIDDAFLLFEQLNKQNIQPDPFTYSSIMKGIKTNDELGLKRANQIYEMVQKDTNIDLLKDIVLCNSLIIMFAKCGDIVAAMDIWNNLVSTCPNIINIRTWNAVLNSQYHNGEHQIVLDLFEQFKDRNQNRKKPLQPQIKTYFIWIKAAMELGNMMKVKEILHFVEECDNHCNSLLRMYTKYMGLEKGIRLWEVSTDKHDVKTFTFMMQLCIDNGDKLKAFELFDEMQNTYQLEPDAHAFVTILKACGNHLELIKEMHKKIIGCGEQFYKDKHLVRVLMQCYQTCGEVELSKQVWNVYRNS
eukprot:107887_1